MDKNYYDFVRAHLDILGLMLRLFSISFVFKDGIIIVEGGHPSVLSFTSPLDPITGQKDFSILTSPEKFESE